MSKDNAVSIYEPQNRDDATWAAETISKSGLAPAGMDNPQRLLVSMMHGASLGLGAMQSVQNIHVIKGKPTLSADLMGAIVRQSSACEYLRETEVTPQRVTMTTARVDDPSHEFARTWTIEDAKRAGLTGSSTWRSYPRQMLRARCLSEICRAVYPEVIGGFYVPGEIEEDKTGSNERPEPQVVMTPEVISRPKRNAETSDRVIDVVPDPDFSPFFSGLLDRIQALQDKGTKHADSAAEKLMALWNAGTPDEDIRQEHSGLIDWIDAQEAKDA